MRKVWIGTVAALALACTAGVGAQTTAAPATSSNQADRNTITVTGCLKPADAMGGATGTSGSTTPGTSSTAGSSSDRFMLANATMGSATTASTGTAGTTPTGTTTPTTAGTSRTGAAPATGSSYMLDGNASELRGHVNHQVEIKGRLDSSASSTASRPSTAPGTTATPATSTPNASAAQTLRVESVRMIAATCPAP
jgi:hypothetical protein